ncbi:MAG: carboxylating nicotinate-nucleotide diphosphorylase [Desulfosalsimonas sp.]
MTAGHDIPLSPQIDRLIDLAVEEDIGHGDITTDAMGLSDRPGRAWIETKEPMVIAGLGLVPRVYERAGGLASFQANAQDGDFIDSPDTVVAEMTGSLAALLIGERIALNFLQRLSGIATHVRRHVDAMGSVPMRLTDTRKTVAGWRVLEKYAVRMGGAFNHRMGLYDGVLIKDNHIAACGSITAAINSVRGRVSHLVRIEVETETLAQVKEAVAAGADVIMLDNMDDAAIGKAVAHIGTLAEIEVSGRVDAGRMARLAELGVNIVSMGALTHAARFVDLSMTVAPPGHD